MSADVIQEAIIGRRSDFKRRKYDAYATPEAAVLPLLPWLKQSQVRTFAEPCAGDGALVRHLMRAGLKCVYEADIIEGKDALATRNYNKPDVIITNPPWTRSILHPLIIHFRTIAPMWLLFDQNWIGTKQAVPFLSSCSDILPIGRIIWIEGTSTPGKDDSAWFKFDINHTLGPIFHPYRSPPGAYGSYARKR
jgi:hypothetical protein